MARASQPFEMEVEADWSAGMLRDAARESMPPHSVYDAYDFLLYRAGIAQKRGGTSYAGPAMTAATYAAQVAYAEFPAGSKLVGIGDNGHLYNVTAGTTTDVSTLGSGFPGIDKPKLRIGGGKNLLIIPASDGTTAPKVYTGAAVATLGGSPPAGRYCEVYKSRLLLGNISGNENRIFFSAVPDIESTWDTTNSWIDADNPITGLAALQNAVLVFSQRATERITGTTPPPGTDMDRAPVGRIGCTDARSIVVYEGAAIFGNSRGIFLTNGTGFRSLTTEGGIESYWQSIMTGYDSSTWTIATGIFRTFLFVTVMNGSTLVDTLMCNVPRVAWWRLTNTKGVMYATAAGVQDELYYADRSTNRVVAMSGIFSPTGSNKADANGTNVAPFMETRLLGPGISLSAFRFASLTYDLRDAATDNPNIAVTVAPGIEATTFAAVPESPLAETSDAVRSRFSVNKQSQGVTLRFAQSGPSAKTEIFALELQRRPFPVQRGGQ